MILSEILKQVNTRMASPEDILADVVVFLRDTLASEDLSVNANQCRLALLHRITSKDSVPFSYVDMNGCNKSSRDTESPGECYEELESSWSGSAGSSNISRSYSNTLPVTSRHQRFSFFFGNSLCDPKNKELSKTCSDPTEFLNDASKRNSMLSDSDHSLSPSSGKSEDSLEIMSISASAIRYSAVKCGLLVRKEKTLFIEHSKRLWVALLGTTLFVYNSERDSKPTYSINVDEYKARAISPLQTNKKEFGFEIVCPGKKTYQFFSSSKSDMETWILAINHSLPLPQTSLVSAIGQALSGDDQIDSKLTECVEKRNYHRDSLRSESMDNPADRELPSIPPMCLHYDTPNPLCRAVLPESKFDQLPSLSSSPQETFYHSIDESIAEQLARYDYPVRNDPVLKNKENFNRHTYSHEDNFYYNISGQAFEQETRENHSLSNENLKKSSISVEEKENMCHKNGFSRIRQLIQKMEEINNQSNAATKKPNSHANESKLMNSQISAVKDEVYELVNAPTYVNINA